VSTTNYLALVERVDAAASAIAARRAGDLVCRRGCTACCQVQLTLAPVEAERVREALAALAPDARRRVRARAQHSSATCVMLEDDGACAIYAARPLVCRTQGHALRYPRESLPQETVFAVSDDGEITWCPLNYTQRAPASEDVLEATRIDELLARVNLDACGGDKGAALDRVAMRALALDR
jgi:Fe-S-cluster containining protein